MTPPSRFVRTLSAAALGLVALAAGGSSAPANSQLPGESLRRPAVVESRVIGRSVQSRPIRAFRVGNPDARRTVVVMAAMHGNELAARAILGNLRNGVSIDGVDMWLVPTYNPDGALIHDRQNARGVDLNRNYPVRWKDLDGSYESGARPRSEPETRAFIAFLNEIDPQRIVSFHQPLYGVDERNKSPRFARRLAEGLRLPIRPFDCGGVCHGTMTQWFNARHDGVAITVELGESPSRRYLTKVAPRGLLRVLGGSR